MTINRVDVYTRVTDRIIEQLEKGARPWLKPWTESAGGAVSRPLRHNGQPYSGINTVLLWIESIEHGYGAPHWMTYKQAQEYGGQVRAGERGACVVYADTFRKTERDQATGEELERTIPFLKAYTVFNVAQVDGLPARFYPAAPAPRGEPIALADAAALFVANTGAVVRHGGNRAFYSPGLDAIQMPPADSFRDAHGYAATLAHELVHWSGNGSRLAREYGKRFGDSAYAREELVAEMGAAFLCADLGIALEPREDHAAYLASWLDVLKADKRAIVTAASAAQRAADYLHGLQPGAVQAAA